MFLRLVCSICLLLSGCAHLGDKSTKFIFPDKHKPQLHHELNQAKQCMERTGVKLKHVATELRVQLRPGERKFAEGWGWRSPEWQGMWVLGLTHGAGNRYRVEMAHDPKTGNFEAWSTARHEFGHYWAMSNFKDWGHSPKYKTCFSGWSDPKSRVLVRVYSTNDTMTIIHFIDEIDAAGFDDPID